MTREEARAFITALVTMRTDATDAMASKTPGLYPTLKGGGSLIPAGTRINWNGTIKKAAVALWDTAESNPANAPTLWADLDYREGYRVIPETLTVSTAFAMDECGWWNGILYRSKLTANVYTPDQYSAGWEVVE